MTRCKFFRITFNIMLILLHLVFVHLFKSRNMLLDSLLLPGIHHDLALEPAQEGSPHVVVDEGDVVASDVVRGTLVASSEGTIPFTLGEQFRLTLM